MANLKQYTLKDTWKEWEITLEVDHDILTEERATVINSFWTSAVDRLSEADDDVVRAVIKLAAEGWVYDLLEAGGMRVDDGRQSQIWTEDRHNKEGWGGTVQGSAFGWCGIRLVSAEIEVDLDLEFQED
ncbi:MULTISPECIES: DUF2528 family protein [Pseudomonas]|uniref:Single-stranded DNA-binding protein n=1 Tax=Pseudomonas chlororaphis TaxID=587753 RepID=A0A3G7TLG9_9PSED|nr:MULTISPECIES: DUF2528 family protein [Pseudomonas]AZE47179.1 hypothetical protein C4K04_1489 [Pseudomonas chlororaphis]